GGKPCGRGWPRSAPCPNGLRPAGPPGRRWTGGRRWPRPPRRLPHWHAEPLLAREGILPLMGRQSTLGRAASGNEAENPVLAGVIRSGRTESTHRGAVIALGPDGAVLDTGQGQVRAGAVDTPMFPRSSNKPMQAAAMLHCGLDLDGKLLALAAASHS